METFVKILGALAGMIIAALFGGFILMKTYEWCVVPFGNAFNFVFPTISYGLFVMLDFGISILRGDSYKTVKMDNDEILVNIVKAFFIKALLLLFMWIFSLIIF